MKTLTGYEAILVSESLHLLKKSIVMDIETNKKNIKKSSESEFVGGLGELNIYLNEKLKDVDSLISKLEEQ